MKKRFRLSLLIWLGALLFLQPLNSAFSQENEQFVGKNKFYDIVDLIQLIEKAREAGFTDEELKTLTIRDGDKTLYAMQYIQEQEKLKALKLKHAEAILKKQYLTVQDILNDLIALEPKQLKQFRDELANYDH